MRNLLLLGILALSITSCTPAALESLGRGLAEGATAMNKPDQQIQKTVVCKGQSFGTFTQASAELSIIISSDGNAQGSFTNNGNGFSANGTAAIKSTSDSVITLDLDNSVEGQAAFSAYAGKSNIGTGLNASKGSKGMVSGTINQRGIFTGTYRAILGNYRVSMKCLNA